MPHRTTCRVIYGDTDTMGYAYNGNYLRWFEIGRSELFRSHGMPYKTIEQAGIFLPVSEMHCKFIAPVAYDDVLIIETVIDAGVKGGMKFDYTLLTRDDEKIRARGFTKHACVDRNGRVIRPPAFLREAVARIVEKEDASNR
jgi:acyl-CoA thioester hydrolase